MTKFDYRLGRPEATRLGLIVLQADETIESDFVRLVAPHAKLFVSRIPSSPEISSETLAAMASHMTQSAALLPGGGPYAAIGYGCTSGAATIGPGRVAELIRKGADAQAVTEPVSALVAACRALDIRRLAFLSPYVESVSAHLRDTVAEQGIDSPVFGTFEEPEEWKVVRISAESIVNAARKLAASGKAEAVFLSCTNLPTLDVIERIEAETGLPVLSSNLVLAWHMLTLAGIETQDMGPGRLFAEGGQRIAVPT